MNIQNPQTILQAQTADKSSLPLKKPGSTKLLTAIGAIIGLISAVPATLMAGDAYVNAGGVRQLIRGFGGASIAQNEFQPPYSDADADNLFGNGWAGQMGLSINRVEITAGGTATNGGWSKHRDIAQKAKARGAITFASPWSPPASFKSNKSTSKGYLLGAYYDDYATWLKSFDTYMAAGGVDLHAISMQNEADYPTDYDSCVWTGTQVKTFMHSYAKNIGTKIIAAESFNYNTALTDPTLNDDTAVSYTSIIGVHLYGGAAIRTYPLAQNNPNNKELWMTEHYLQDKKEINYFPRCWVQKDAVTLAKEIHDCMTIANMNAYVWWWLKDNYIGFINRAGAVTKYGYAAGHFAKFVRPGYYRVDATYNPSEGIYVSAYKSGTKLTIVAINNSDKAVSQTFRVQNLAVSSMNRYNTTATDNMKLIGGTGFSGGVTTITLPAQSITTLVK